MALTTSPENDANTAASFWATTARLRLDAIKTSAPNCRRRQEMLKHEIQALRSAMDSANKLYNSQTGICSLPSETLSEIFAYAKDIWKPRAMYYTTREALERPHGLHREHAEIMEYKDPKPPESVTQCRAGWMSLTHVCSYWREIILNSPTSWASHANCLEIHPDWLPDIMYRSRTLPLDLTFDRRTQLIKQKIDSAGDASLEWLTRSVSPRVKRLSFVDCTPKLWRQLRNIRQPLNLRLDRLEELNIDISGLDDRDNEHADECLRHVLTDWKSNLAPLLQKLTLRCAYMVWDSEILAAKLTDLHIELHPDGPMVNIPKYRELAKLLRSYTSLERLTLITAIPSTVPNPPRIVLAPTLRYLRLGLASRTSSRHEHCVKFLQQLTVPESCAVHLDVNISLQRDDHIGALRGPVGRAFAHLYSLTPPLELVVDAYYLNMHRTLTSREAWGDYSSINTNSHTVSVGWGAEAWRILESDHVPDLTSLRALSFTRRVYPMSTPGSVDRDQLDQWEFFTSAVNVKRVGIPFDGEPLSLLEALSELSSGETSTFKLCPTFDTLVCTTDPKISRGYQQPAETHRSSIMALIHLAQKRKEHGAPIREFVVDAALREWTVWEAFKEDAVVTFLKLSIVR